MDLKTLIPLGTRMAMPAIVAGYEVATRPTIPAAYEPPEWLLCVEQQAGGISMSYPTLIGAVLRLETNGPAFAVREPSPLIRCFHAMAEAPDLEYLEEHCRALHAICRTTGAPLDATELFRLGALLSRYFVLPRPVQGIEACVALDPEEGIEKVLGWKTIVAEPGTLGIAAEVGYGSWRDGPVFDDACALLLQRFGTEVLKTQMAPSLFLIWENSD